MLVFISMFIVNDCIGRGFATQENPFDLP